MGTYRSSYISHTAVTKLYRVLVKNFVVLVLMVEVSVNQITEYPPNIGVHVCGIWRVIPYDTSTSLLCIVNIIM